MHEVSNAPTYTPSRRHGRDELVGTYVHAAGWAISAVAVTLLMIAIVRQGDPLRIATCAVYSATLVGMYAGSTLSHLFYNAARRRYYRVIDQAVIFLLIAGTYTPFATTSARPMTWVFLAGVWGVAFAGCFMKLYSGRQHIGHYAMATYILLGWVPGLVLIPTLERLPFSAGLWLVIGGIFYSIGTVFLTFDRKIPFGHTAWHLFVVVASACHFVAILYATHLLGS